MPRRRRGSVPRGTRRRSSRRFDWVYRSDIRAAAAQPGSDRLGTYDGQIKSFSSGQANASSVVLYDSSMKMSGGTMAPGPGVGFYNRAGRAEGRKAQVKAVEGIVYLEPTMWALGNLIACGLRIAILEQDLVGGQGLVDAEYSMWTNGLQTQPSTWANQGRQNMWERRIHYGFAADAPAFVVARVRWTGLRRLEPHEALYMYIELESTSVNVRSQWWLRSLVADEG